LVSALGDDRLDTAPPQVQADLLGGVALVAQQAIRAGAGPADAAAQPELGHHRFEDGAVHDVAAGQMQGQRQATSFGDQVEFGGRSAAGASEGLLPLGLFRIDRLAVVPLFRAPAACWWARAMVESILTVSSTVPIESSLTCRSSKILAQVPSSSQRLNRS